MGPAVTGPPRKDLDKELRNLWKKGVKTPSEWSEAMIAKDMVFNTTSDAGFSSEALSGPRDSALYGKTEPFPFFLVSKSGLETFRKFASLQQGSMQQTLG